MMRALLFAVLLVCLPVATSAAKADPQGTRIVVAVARLATLVEITAGGEQGMLGELTQQGIAESELSDGSVAAGIVYCCGGKITTETRVYFYVPAHFRVAVGDVVEVALGRVPSKKQRKNGDIGAVNRGLKVRESFNDESGACRWDPENETLWMRVLYCDWMLAEGWEYRGGLKKGWFKLPTVNE